MLTQSDLVRDLRALGIQPGMTVLTHSSFKSLGPVEGGPQTVVNALIEAVSPNGTAAFPTHTWDGVSPEAPPVFDVRTSPSKVIGVIPEFARQTPGGVRSVHGTHSVVAFGPDAVWLTDGHSWSPTQCGVGSPYDKLCSLGGKILLLGVTHDRNTSIHMSEELAGVLDALQPVQVEATLTGYHGVEYRALQTLHSWRDRDFEKLEPIFLSHGLQVNGKVGAATARLVDASGQRAWLLEKLASKPEFLFKG